ncbi:MAG TPA: TetR/AcrR family transcriptional regulator [Prolixibacteraceae bacterium]|nr:TetR/AcrR family transcriptional regulator [Prolixibacteraceae bacterium]
MGEIRELRINEIIEAAISEFLEKGYDNASMEGIARRANLSKGGLYHHFKSKAEILIAVNQKFTEPIQAMMEKIESAPSLPDGLKQYLTDYLTYWDQHRRELSLYFLTMDESFSNPELMALYKDSAREMFDYFGYLFSKGQEQGVFRRRNARAQAVAMISCLDGFLAYLLIDDTLTIETIGAEIHHLFIDQNLK